MLFGHWPQELGTQYIENFSLFRLSTSSIQLGASASIPLVGDEQVRRAHHIHPCRLYKTERFYVLPRLKLLGPGHYDNAYSARASLYHLWPANRLEGCTTSVPAPIINGKDLSLTLDTSPILGLQLMFPLLALSLPLRYPIERLPGQQSHAPPLTGHPRQTLSITWLT